MYPLPCARIAEYAWGVVTNLEEIRRLGASKVAENLDFRRYLAARHQPLGPFHILANEIQQHVDCTECANCCRFSIVSVNHAEIEAIARHLDCAVEEVLRKYTEPDRENSGARVLRSTRQGCVFLAGNLCAVYTVRPKACRDFPYIASETRSLGGRLSSICRWAALCPIVFNALESYKRLVGYHPPRDPQTVLTRVRTESAP